MVTTEDKALGDIMLPGYRCRCGHEWTARDRSKRPKVCPKCKSANWDEPRRPTKK